MTKAGQRFHQMGYARYIVQVPTVYERLSTGALFRPDHYSVTGDQVGWNVELNVRGAPEQALSQLNRLYDEWVASGAAQAAVVPGSDYGPSVKLHVDTTRRPRFDMQQAYVRDGKRTVDTILDRVVFGEPVFAEDLWNLHRLHESSRRRSNECGLDVIVASAMWRRGHTHTRQPMMTASEAAQRLVQLAVQLDPDGTLFEIAEF